MQLFHAKPPEITQRQNVPIMRSCRKQGLDQSALILSRSIVCAPVHFTTHTFPCDRALGKPCLLCQRQQSARWNGWLAVWHHGRQQRELLELTHGAAAVIAEQGEVLRSLRGWIIRIHRKHASAPLQVGLTDSQLDPDAIPDPFDVAAELKRMWRLDDRADYHAFIKQTRQAG